MGQVVIDVSTSLDGFVAGSGVSDEEPMGDGGELLHEWTRGGEPGRGVDLVDELHRDTGAVVMGRRTFDVGLKPWGDVPFAGTACFVVTHRPRADLPQASGTFSFVTEGIETALARAQEAAGDRDVLLMGGDCGRQFLAARLVDELRLHVTPLLLGAGSSLFAADVSSPLRLERTELVEAPGVTHLRFRVRGPAGR